MLLAFSVLFVGSTRARNVKAEPSLSQEYLDNPVSKGKNYEMSQFNKQEYVHLTTPLNHLLFCNSNS